MARTASSRVSTPFFIRARNSAIVALIDANVYAPSLDELIFKSFLAGDRGPGGIPWGSVPWAVFLPTRHCGADAPKLSRLEQYAYLALMTKKRLLAPSPVSPIQQVQPNFSPANNIFLID